MNPFSLKKVKETLKKYGLQPSKGLGQNFLIDGAAVRKMIEAAEINPEDTILEIGPGLGVLTQELAQKAERVLAIEKDPEMVRILQETLKECEKTEIVQGDALKIESYKLKTEKYKVVGNLPFYLTAPLIRRFLEKETIKPQEMVFIVQKEVARRICSKPPEMNLLAVSVQFYSQPKIVSYIPKGSFWPQPKVDAAILKIIPAKPGLADEERGLFFRIVKAGFSQPRKQLINNLSAGLNMEKEKIAEWLKENNVSPQQRAETLKIEDWLKLTKNLKMEE